MQFKKTNTKLTPLSKLINLFFSEKEAKTKTQLIILWKNWSKILGPTLSKLAKPIGTKKNTLIIGVEDSILMQELTFYQDEILKKINVFLGHQVFDKINYKLLEDKTPLDKIFVKKRKDKENKYQLPEKIGELTHFISRKSPVYKAYISYIRLIKQVKNVKEDINNE